MAYIKIENDQMIVPVPYAPQIKVDIPVALIEALSEIKYAADVIEDAIWFFKTTKDAISHEWVFANEIAGRNLSNYTIWHYYHDGEDGGWNSTVATTAVAEGEYTIKLVESLFPAVKYYNLDFEISDRLLLVKNKA
jgi:hypothetical protein